MSEIKLKPNNCPCCGEELEVIDDGQYYAHKINGCILQHLCFRADEEESIKLWNTRKPMERIVERLEEVSHEYITEPSDLGFVTKGRRVYLKDAIEIVKEEGGILE